MFVTSFQRRWVVAVIGSGLALSVAVSGCSSKGSKSSPSETTESAVAVDGSACPASAATVHTFAAAPPMTIDAAKTYTAVMKTTRGTIEFLLDPKRAPIAVNNFVFLARQRYFDCIGFHRVVPGFVLQGGDPNSIDAGASGPVGTGGPGYEFVDELPNQGEYRFGSLAMANSGPNTNGSQFFIISGPQGEQLPPLYTLFGQAAKGEEAITAIDALGLAGTDGPPSEPVTIVSVTITES